MYWVSIMHYNINASVFRTGDPIQLTIGNPAYFPYNSLQVEVNWCLDS